MKAYVLIETAAGKTKNVKKALAKIKSARATVARALLILASAFLTFLVLPAAVSIST